MPMSGEKHRFTRENLDLAPDAPGVYALYGGTEVSFYGTARADETIRTRLEKHLLGQQVPGPDEATAFSFEVTRFPLARTHALLDEHRRRERRLPPYNEPPPGSRLFPPAGQPAHDEASALPVDTR